MVDTVDNCLGEVMGVTDVEEVGECLATRHVLETSVWEYCEELCTDITLQRLSEE